MGEITDIIGIGKATEKGIDVVGQFLERLFGPAFDEAGQALADPIKNYRLKRQQRGIKMLEVAKDELDAAGIEPQPVVGRILFPILEHGSLEEDETLTGQWAALLANAATPGFTHILPAYAETLRQLTPKQAHILSWMYEEGRKYQERYSLPGAYPDFKRDDVEQAHSLSPSDYALLITDMERLQLIEPRRVFESSEEGWHGEEMFRAIVARWNSRVKYDLISFTTLGLRFMEACTPPVKNKRKK